MKLNANIIWKNHQNCTIWRFLTNSPCYIVTRNTESVMSPKFSHALSSQSFTPFSASNGLFSTSQHYGLMIARILYDWNHVSSIRSLLVSQVQNDILKSIHADVRMTRLIVLSDVPLCRQTPRLTQLLEMSVHLNCFHLGIFIVNKAARSIFDRVCKQVCISLLTRREVSRLESEILQVWKPLGYWRPTLLCPKPLKRSQMGV